VVISPTQQTALGKPIDEAAKKVKIIGIDSAADSNSFTSFLQTDNEKGGRIAADAVAAAIQAKYGKAEGQVALINFLPGVGSLQARDKGFKEQLAAKYPGLKLVAEKVADGQAVTGLNIMTDLITAYPDLRGVFSDALFIGQGAGQAIAENKAGDRIKFIGTWLNHGADLYIFDEPTVGVDVGTKVEIYKLFAKLLKNGAGIILISSYLPEVYDLSDTLHVFRRGRLVASYDSAHNSEKALHETILTQALGV